MPKEKIADLEAEINSLIDKEIVLIREKNGAENALKENQKIIASKKEYLEALKIIDAHDSYEETGCAHKFTKQCDPVCVCYLTYGETGVLLKGDIIPNG
tara:strand:+ start:315 stop:611 length:297 start_codon:yes stop_codon:yes gene_type:complete